MRKSIDLWLVLALFALLAATPGLADEADADPPPPPVSSTDPKYISAKADQMKAQNDRIRALIELKLSHAQEALIRAQAEREFAVAAYIRELQRILIIEYDEIQKQQARLQRLIEEIRWNDNLAQRISLGHTDAGSFQAMMRLIAGATEFDPIRDVLNKKVEPLAAPDNFRINDTEEGMPRSLRDFPGGDVRRLLLFVRRHNYSLVQLGDAHWLILEGLAAIRRTAEHRILRAEQEIQAVRASRIGEVFIPPK